MRVLPSARKHGVRDGDIRHAVRNPIRTIWIDDGMLVIGPARDGALLEIGISIDAEERIFHAMPARWKHLVYAGP